MGTVEKGKTGEEKAAEYLKRKGFEILFRNYRYGHKEIDIIARDKKYIVFVEVKAGKSKSFGPPQGWVDLRKQRKLAEVAKYFLHRHKFPGYDFRFDVIAIEESSSKQSIEHIENAFYLD
ncbi:MAG: YraN family protein [candidate division Zixibacteria bacterium]|nr:YraN family protein [candidate division Zixibacteria bacterium]